MLLKMIHIYSRGICDLNQKLRYPQGYDGMDCIAHIIQSAAKYLVNEGWLFIEHGYDQVEACQLLLEKQVLIRFAAMRIWRG